MKKLLAFAAALAMVLTFSARPAEAFHQVPPTVVDRNAFTLTYIPLGAGASQFSFGLSYRDGSQWDYLLSYSSASPGTNTAWRIGGRYHVPPPSPDVDVYGTLQYASETSAGVSTTAFLVGGGVTQTLAPTLKAYYNLTYHSELQLVLYDLGLQYQIARQVSLVAGINSGAGYLGFSYRF